VSLKSRLRRLDAGVRWLETEGVLIRWQLMMKLVQRVQDIADHMAGDPEFAAQWKKNVPSLPLPKPRVKVPPRVRPMLRDAAVPAAPQDEGVHVAPPAPLPPPSQPPPRPPPPPPPKPRWTKDIRPGPHDVLTWEEAMQVPWFDPLKEDDGS
jgi:hypothetical protein